MGQPLHYSVELPERCLHLIEALLPIVRGGVVGPDAEIAANGIPFPGQEDLGPLTTTFLLAMATPIISLPIERLSKPGREGESYLDDGLLDRRLAKIVRSALGTGAFSETRFSETGWWRYFECPYHMERLAWEIPDNAATGLEQEKALDDAASMESWKWAACLRNALAHGGVFYLDERGRSANYGRVHHLAFVSGEYVRDDEKDRPKLIGLRFLRISEHHFLEFLRAWVGWLSESGVWRNLPLAA